MTERPEQPWIPLTVEVRAGAAPPKAPPRAAARTATAGDQGYIASTWLRQMADADRDYSRGGRWGQAGHHVDMVLDRPDTRAIVVHPTADPNRILGWMVYAEVPNVPTVHFLYIRREERERGYASALLRRIGVKRDEPSVFTCHGPCERLLLKQYPLATHLALWRFLGLTYIDVPAEERWKTKHREDPNR